MKNALITRSFRCFSWRMCMQCTLCSPRPASFTPCGVTVIPRLHDTADCQTGLTTDEVVSCKRGLTVVKLIGSENETD